MADGTLSVNPGTVGATGMRYHELALQRWLYGNFAVREGYPIPVVFSSPMDAFGNFDKLWKSDRNPFKYLFDLKDERGTPLYEPYPSNLRYPLISVFRRGWRYRPDQNYSIHQFRKLNWPTVSDDVGRCQLGNVTTSYRPMAWDYRWQIDHYAMRPDTQAYFVEKLMRSMWITGGTPQCWVEVRYPGIGIHKVRMFIEGDIENGTLEEPEDQKHVEFRTTFTLCMEGYSVDQDIQFVPALWTLLIRGQQEASPDEVREALDQQEIDLRLGDDNVTMLSRQNVPSDEECQRNLAQYGTYPVYDITLSGSLQPAAYEQFGISSTNISSPYLLAGIPPVSIYGTHTITLLAGTTISAGSRVESGTVSGVLLYGANERFVMFDVGFTTGSFTGGEYVLRSEPGGTYSDSGTIVGNYLSGTYFETVVHLGTWYAFGTTQGVFGTGVYAMTSVDGGTRFDAGTIAGVFLAGTSALVIGNAGTWYAAGTINGVLLSGSYA